MRHLLTRFRRLSGPIKSFWLTVISLTLLIVGTTVWSYARLLYLRSGEPPVSFQVKQHDKKKGP